MAIKTSNTKIENENTERMARVIAAIKAANCPDYLISGMTGRMPKNWLTGTGGDKPSREQLVLAALCTKNAAGAEGGFHALQSRDSGASLAELAYAFNCGPAHNHSKAIAQGTGSTGGLGYFFRSQVGPGRWHMAITAKGEKFIMGKLAGVNATLANAQPVKAQPVKKAKAKKAKAKPVITEGPVTDQPVTVDPAVTVEPVEPVISEPVTETALSDLAAHFNN